MEAEKKVDECIDTESVKTTTIAVEKDTAACTKTDDNEKPAVSEIKDTTNDVQVEVAEKTITAAKVAEIEGIEKKDDDDTEKTEVVETKETTEIGGNARKAEEIDTETTTSKAEGTTETITTGTAEKPAANNGETLEDMSPQYVQKKLYFLVEKLKEMHAKLPEQFQTRISNELLNELATSLLNDTTYDIVKGLMEIQHVTEKHLHQLREKLKCQHDLELHDWLLKITDHEEVEHIKRLLKLKYKKKRVECDKESINLLDQKVQDQQLVMQKAGVAGFYPTNDAKEIQIQMYLFDFILRLSCVKFDPAK